MKLLSVVLLILMSGCCLLAQTQSYIVPISKTTTAVRVDGLLEDAAWQTATRISDFTQTFPVDTVTAQHRTEVQLAFDDQYLYVAATCWQQRDQYTVQSLRRDFGPGTSDVINILLSPFKDGLNGFMFGVNPLNVQREGMIDNGSNLSLEWDNRWFSAVQNGIDRWTVEMAIPFKTLRYTVVAGQNTWHLNFIRTTLKPWEVSTWKPVSRQFPSLSLAFTGELVWQTPPPAPRANVALIPYAAGSTASNVQRDVNTLHVVDRARARRGAVGGDAKIGITPSLNLDLTVNPDFSQVEVDRQVTNLQRFELFFPERRQFFLENRDLFALFGFPPSRPFFSRRIGLAYNPVKGQNQTVPIQAGARLSGKLNDNWRVGLLNMQTAKARFSADKVLPAANFTVATLQRKVFERSAISGIFVNKQNFTQNLTETERSGTLPWNRVAGLEYNLYSKDNRWEGEAYYHRSLSPDPAKRGGTGAVFLGYRDRYFNANLGFARIDSTYQTDVGFVPRSGVNYIFPGIGWTFYPNKAVNNVQVGIEGTVVQQLNFWQTDRQITAYVNASFRNQSGLGAGVTNNYTFLFFPFDPTNQYEAQPLPDQVGYTYTNFWTEYRSSVTYNLQANVRLETGQYFNGQYASANGEVTYRLQPYGSVGMGYSYNRIRLPQPYASADLWLLSPRVELSLSRSLFLSSFFQYNTQANNFNINTRLQWRFAPVSDVYLVYTDNSFAYPVANTPVQFLSPKNRALVLKVVYWLAV